MKKKGKTLALILHVCLLLFTVGFFREKQVGALLVKGRTVPVLLGRKALVETKEAPHKLTLPQKQGRVNRLLRQFVKHGVSIANATTMLKQFEEKNRVWGVSNQEFVDFVSTFGANQTAFVKVRMLLLWRDPQFQSLIKQYVA